LTGSRRRRLDIIEAVLWITSSRESLVKLFRISCAFSRNSLGCSQTLSSSKIDDVVGAVVAAIMDVIVSEKFGGAVSKDESKTLGD
jgi:hypothetical protein